LGRDPQPGLALLQLAQGRVTAASTSIRSALVAEAAALRRPPLLAAQIEIELTAGDTAAADRACGELEAIAATYASSGLALAARHARGAVMLASGAPEAAVPVLWEACRRWNDLDAPYDGARARILLAQAYRSLGDEGAMARELDVAEATFRRLGASVELRGVERVRRGSALPAGLSRREAQVLSVLAAGKTNRELASELGISPKTVARHLSNIFAKIGVSSRAAAAVFAVEHGLTRPDA
jgi:DNA-binding CsgD family transcriptional regulator